MSKTKIYTPKQVLARQPRTVTLTPVVMPFPNRHCVYAPHPERSAKSIPFAEFARKYAPYPTQMRVCFTKTNDSEKLYSQSKQATAVGYGLEGWFVVTGIQS